MLAAALVSVGTTVGIVFSLLFETASFFREVSIVEFLTGTEWTPLFVPRHFGVLPLLSGTLMIAVGSAVVAIPVGLLTAVFLGEYAPEGLRKVLKPTLEILAGIPTVVYGFFALTFITPLLRSFIPDVNIFNAASAAIAVGIMTIPMVASMSEDAILSVSRSLREGAFALGATKLQVIRTVVLPAASSGILASFILGFSRAVGETMIVTLAAGATPKLTPNPFESIQTMTAFIVQVSLGDTPHGSLEYRTIFAVGTTLFVFTLLMNIISQVVARRFREAGTS